jgi:hypothetical protein
MAAQMKSVSALQMQRYLGHRYYRPIWLMMQKLRIMMADLVDWYAMLNHLAAGTTSFPAVGEPPETIPDGLANPFPGIMPANRQFIADMQPCNDSLLEAIHADVKGLNLQLPLTHDWNKRARGGRLRLISMCPESIKTAPYNRHHPVFRKTTPVSPHQLPDGQNIRIRSIDNRPRPWFAVDPLKGRLGYTDIMVVNAKRNLDGIHHYVSKRYLRNYLGEFCYLTNRRYSGEQKLEQMMALFVSKPWNLPYIVQASD